MKIFQKGFNFSEDGPGNRLVYHVAGCNMRCRWCANPEGFTALPEHKELSAQDILKEADSCRMLFFEGGGVTFTGGEATLHADELITVLKLLKEAGIHTAIETNGTSKRLWEILRFTDYLMMDFKHFDDEAMKRYTGIDTETIKDNYRRIAESGRQCHIRIPLIREFNADAAKGLAAFFSEYPSESIVFEFLPYHEYGKAKWSSEYLIRDGFVSPEAVAHFKKTFEEHGLTCIKS